MDLTRLLPYISTGVLILSGLVVLYATYKINKIRLRQAKIEEDIANKKLKSLEHEFDNKRALFDQTAKITAEISASISQQLINNPGWLDRFMDETGVTYRASVFGKRIGHFFYEKRKIAEEAINKVEECLKREKSLQYYLLIDSGTTMYPLFVEITRRLQKKETKTLWQRRVCLVTNNIPGVQYIMKNGKDDPNDDYSEITIDCLLVPGRPLSVYAAITGDEATEWLRKLKALLDCRKAEGENIKVISFVTGNYMARKEIGKVHYHPVARGEGHIEIKQAMVDIGDDIFLLSPLMKFSFAGVDLLNEVNGFDIPREDFERARQHPRKVKYEEIIIPQNKSCTYFTTRRVHGCMFEQFSNALRYELRQNYGSDSVVMPDFDVKYWNPNIEDNRQLEIEREIPHPNLRNQFEKGINIWDRDWVLDKEQLKSSAKGI